MAEPKYNKIKDVRQILLISLSCIGDVLLTTPVAKVLKDHYPMSKLTVLSGKTAYPLLKNHELVSRALIYDNHGMHKGAGGMAKLIAMLRDTKYDLVVDLRNTAIPYALRARYRITAHKSHLSNRDARGRHAIDRHLDVLESYGFAITCRTMQLNVPLHAAETVERIVAERGQDTNGVFVGVYPGAGSHYKQYPPDKFKAVVQELSHLAPAAQIAVVGGASDAAAAAEVAAAAPGRCADYSGRLDILETAALVRKCSVFISNDSGPMHIASALNVPTVAIFGPTDALRYGPRGDIHRIVWRREKCNPCKAPTCEKESCINHVREQDVVCAAAEILGVDYTPPADGCSSVSSYSQLQLFDEEDKR